MQSTKPPHGAGIRLLVRAQAVSNGRRKLFFLIFAQQGHGSVLHLLSGDVFFYFKDAVRIRHPGGGAREGRGPGGGTIPVLEAKATMATADTARSTAMIARAQRRDFTYMGSPEEGRGQAGDR